MPKYSKGTLDVIGAQIIKSIAFSVEEPSVKDELNKLGLQLYSSGTKTMSYDDEWYCGNGPHPIPHFGTAGPFFNPSEVELNPQPLPPRSKYYGAILSVVAESISDNRIVSALHEISNRLIQESASGQ